MDAREALSAAADRPTPGADPGACPDCGEWRKAGVLHECPPSPFRTPGTRLSEARPLARREERSDC